MPGLLDKVKDKAGGYSNPPAPGGDHSDAARECYDEYVAASKKGDHDTAYAALCELIAMKAEGGAVTIAFGK